MSKIQTL